EHSLIFALIEINNASTTRAGLDHSSAKVRRAALIALDQMDEQTLQTEDILPLLSDSDDRLQATALEVATGRNDWGNSLSNLVDAWLALDALPEEQALHLEKLLCMHHDKNRLTEAFGKARSEQ